MVWRKYIDSFILVYLIEKQIESSSTPINAVCLDEIISLYEIKIFDCRRSGQHFIPLKSFDWHSCCVFIIFFPYFDYFIVANLGNCSIKFKCLLLIYHLSFPIWSISVFLRSIYSIIIDQQNNFQWSTKIENETSLMQSYCELRAMELNRAQTSINTDK